MIKNKIETEKINNIQQPFNKNALITLKKRYLKKNKELEIIETPKECLKRVAKHISKAEKKGSQKLWEERFYRVMINKEFLPNSPTIMNSGNKKRGCLSACFVLPIEDSLESIMETLKRTALIFREGGGVGINFSNIRPDGDIISSTTSKGKSTGVLSFMRLFDEMISVVKQGGTRRGAMMGMLRIDHPDISNFIKSKRNNGETLETEFENLNISVLITKDFINCLKNNKLFKLINPRTNEVDKLIDPNELFNEIIKSAYKSGDPGMIFMDRINKNNPLKEKIQCVNPCGEQPLLPYESCNLGSINIKKFTNNININQLIDKRELKKGKITDFIFDKLIKKEKLKNIVETAVRFLDNVISVNKFPLKKIEVKTKKNRKIGLGIMGYADMLYKLQIPYDSKLSENLAEKLMAFINETAHKYSEYLAISKKPFPNYKNSNLKTKRRNASITTIAPTGSISIIAETSSGIEPNFLLAYNKNVLGGLKIVNKELKEYLKNNDYDSKRIIDKIIENNGSINGILEEDELLHKVFKTAHEISWKWHIRIQEAFQKHTDNAISKTINLPKNSDIEEVDEIYRKAIESDVIKGITVFRDGCLQKQVLTKVEKCPKCKEGILINDGKCKRCDSCGYSNKCSI